MWGLIYKGTTAYAHVFFFSFHFIEFQAIYKLIMYFYFYFILTQTYYREMQPIKKLVALLISPFLFLFCFLVCFNI